MGIISLSEEKIINENGITRRSLSVESQPKIMPIAAVDRTILRGSREI